MSSNSLRINCDVDRCYESYSFTPPSSTIGQAVQRAKIAQCSHMDFSKKISSDILESRVLPLLESSEVVRFAHTCREYQYSLALENGNYRFSTLLSDAAGGHLAYDSSHRMTLTSIYKYSDNAQERIDARLSEFFLHNPGYIIPPSDVVGFISAIATYAQDQPDLISFAIKKIEAQLERYEQIFFKFNQFPGDLNPSEKSSLSEKAAEEVQCRQSLTSKCLKWIQRLAETKALLLGETPPDLETVTQTVKAKATIHNQQKKSAKDLARRVNDCVMNRIDFSKILQPS